MNRILPLDHPLVRVVVRALGEAMVADNPAIDGPWIIGHEGVQLIAELVSATLPKHYLNLPGDAA
jgi:hypothetical protein